MPNKDGANSFLKLFNVSRETLALLFKFEEILYKYNDKMNLIGRSTLENIWQRHFADSAKIFPIIKELSECNKESLRICDVGTGAGFPGLVLAILNCEANLKIKISLIDSNKKKYFFLRNVLEELGLNLELINDRVEIIHKKYDVIIARAVSPLSKLLKISFNIGKKNSVYIFPKGKKWQSELDELKNRWNYKVNIVKNNILIDKSGGVTLILKEVKLKK